MMSRERIQTLLDLIRPICRGQGKRFQATGEQIAEAENEVLVRLIGYLKHRDLTSEELIHYGRRTGLLEAKRFFRGEKSRLRPDRNVAATATSAGSDPLVRIIEVEDEERLHRAIRQLPAEQAEALETWFNPKSSKPVRALALRLGIKERQIYDRRNKALASLRALFRISKEN